jgi:hypothetical protein
LQLARLNRLRKTLWKAGDITGSYLDAAGIQHGFVRDPYGTITSFDPPESKFTNVTGINEGGAMSGYYSDQRGLGPGVGFIRVPCGPADRSPVEK